MTQAIGLFFSSFFLPQLSPPSLKILTRIIVMRLKWSEKRGTRENDIRPSLYSFLLTFQDNFGKTKILNATLQRSDAIIFYSSCTWI